jgi:ArsR family transcriptional regulator
MSNYSKSFKALGSPARLELLRRIAGCCRGGCRCGDMELCISSLAQGLNLSKATISHHVKILSQAGLISLTKQGREVYCQVNSTHLKQLVAQLSL